MTHHPLLFPNPETKGPAHTWVKEGGLGAIESCIFRGIQRERERKLKENTCSRQLQLLCGWDLASRDDDTPRLPLRNPQTDLNTVRSLNGSDKGTGRVRSVAGMLPLLVCSSLA